MSNASDFVIENGVLKEYTGAGGAVVIPDGVVRVEHFTFRDNHNIKKIVFGKNISGISAWAFSGCTNIEEFEVSEDSTHFCSVDGIIFSKDMKTLELFPKARGGEYTIPESVEKIGGYAFDGNQNIEKVNLPENLFEIENGAFFKCDNIKSIFIPKNVTEIDWVSSFGKGLEEIIVDPKNKKFAEKAGIIFSTKFKTIQYCPRGRKGEIVLPETISGINSEAFSGCSGITKINIPEKVTKIGAGAFENCSKLNEIVIPENVSSIGYAAFEGCSGIKEITLPSKIKVIPESSFENCNNLEKVSFPKGLESIEGKAFNGCDMIKEVVLPITVCKLGNETFSPNTAVICPAELFKRLPTPTKETTCIKYLEEKERFSERLSENIIAYIKKNKSVFFERLIKEGNTTAFKSCLELFKVTKAIINECLEFSSRYNKPEINFVLLADKDKTASKNVKKEEPVGTEENTPEQTEKYVLTAKEAKKIFRLSLTPIGATINGYKGEDKKVIIPDIIDEYPVVEIKKDAFRYNRNIEEVLIPDSVVKIGRAFEGCENLKKVNLPECLEEIDSCAFWDCINLQKTKIPEKLKKIGESAFTRCSKFADENGFVIIGDVLFGYFGNEEKVVIPDGVKKIDAFAFENRTKLKEIFAPKSLKKIGYEAFRDCYSLEKIHLPKNLSSISGTFDVFSSSRKVTIYAPAGSRAEAYAKEYNKKFVAE